MTILIMASFFHVLIWLIWPVLELLSTTNNHQIFLKQFGKPLGVLRHISCMLSFTFCKNKMIVCKPLVILCLMNSFSWGVSKDTASIQCLLQMFLASSQSTSKLRVGPCSQLKKYACATPLASLYVECLTPVNIKIKYKKILPGKQFFCVLLLSFWQITLIYKQPNRVYVRHLRNRCNSPTATTNKGHRWSNENESHDLVDRRFHSHNLSLSLWLLSSRMQLFHPDCVLQQQLPVLAFSITIMSLIRCRRLGGVM